MKDQPPENRFRDALMRYRTVQLVGDIDRNVVADVATRLLTLQIASANPIKLVINSNGGKRDHAMVLYDLIRYGLTAPVEALVIGMCASAATFVLLACDKRLAMPHARFVMHSGSLGDISIKGNEVSLQKASRVVEEVKKYAEQGLQFYMKALDKPREEILKLIERGDEEYDNVMTAEEANGIGLVTQIVHENVGIFPSSDPASH